MTEDYAAIKRAVGTSVRNKRAVRLGVIGGVYRALLYLVVLVGAFSMILPMAWMVSTSLKEPGSILHMPPEFFPRPVYVWNYRRVFELSPFGSFYINSFKISTLATLGNLLSCSLGAFAFARLRFPGKGFFFSILMATMMVPFPVTIIPTFAIMRWLGWIDSHAALIVPSWFGGAFAVFLLRQHFLTLPQDLVDAARMDGARYFAIYWRIFMPLSGPVLATLSVLNFMWSWNDLIGPLIFLSTLKKMTVTLGLTFFKGQLYYVLWGPLMAATTLSMLPTLILFVSAQRYFVRGIVLTGLKG